jgi:hypothetical protein
MEVGHRKQVGLARGEPFTLGGHVARCEGCAHTVIAYNSCLMGRSSNGELACRHRHFGEL